MMLGKYHPDVFMKNETVEEWFDHHLKLFQCAETLWKQKD